MGAMVDGGHGRVVVLVVKLVGHQSCGADRLPVAVRFPAGPRVRLKTVDPPKGNGLGQIKRMVDMAESRWCGRRLRDLLAA